MIIIKGGICLVSGKHRNTYALIDKNAIFNNIKNQMNLLEPDTEVYAVVKADGYGHGALEVATIAREAGVQGFCVALIDEALELRQAGFKEPILIMGLVEAKYAKLLLDQRISIAVGYLKWLEEAEFYLKREKSFSGNRKLDIHLAIDTGMGRVGFRTSAELAEVESYLTHSTSFNCQGVFTHFATADSKDTKQFHQQVEKFQKLVEGMTVKPTYIHSANSATSLWHQKYQKRIVRLGIAMYGLNPSGRELDLPIKLEPAMSVETTLVQVKQMSAGETVSYGATYKAKEGEWIGTLPIGYADGWRRSLQGQTVLVEGERCEIVGRICMDQCMIRLNKEVPIGTKVVLIGKDQNDEISAQEIAEYLDTINYEIVCGFTQRLPRVYC